MPRRNPDLQKLQAGIERQKKLLHESAVKVEELEASIDAAMKTQSKLPRRRKPAEVD